MPDKDHVPGVFDRFGKIVLIAARTPRILKASVRVALVVGTVLNRINQGRPLLIGGPVSITQLLMNFLVPFCVSSYSAARNELVLQEIEKNSQAAAGNASVLQMPCIRSSCALFKSEGI